MTIINLLCHSDVVVFNILMYSDIVCALHCMLFDAVRLFRSETLNRSKHRSELKEDEDEGLYTTT